MSTHKKMSKKRKMVADGIFKAELDEFFKRELAEDGYSGVEVRVTPTRTEVIVLATRTQSVLGEKGRRIRELTSCVQKRFGFTEDSVQLYAEKVPVRGLCAIAQCESLRYKLTGGLAVRRACYGVVRYIMESGATGCEVIVSGKLRGQRAKSMKFVDGVMVHSGNPVNDYIDAATRKVLLRQGILGLKVKIMLPHDPLGKRGPKTALPDHVEVVEPKDEAPPAEPKTEVREVAAQQGPPGGQQQQQQQQQQQPGQQPHQAGQQQQPQQPHQMSQQAQMHQVTPLAPGMQPPPQMPGGFQMGAGGGFGAQPGSMAQQGSGMQF